MTYLYWFTKYAGSDKIRKTDHKFKSGDLLKLWEEYFLVLWSDVSFAEQYVYDLKEEESKYEIVHKKFLNKQTIDLIHWMVYRRYATYYNVVPKLFLPTEVEKLVDRKVSPLSRGTKGDSKKAYLNKEDSQTLAPFNKGVEGVHIKAPLNKGGRGDIDFKNISFPQKWQTLIVFPDLRTLMNLTDEKFVSQTWVEVLLSSNTQNQKDKSRRNIKNGNTNIILATHSEVFQNYKDLQKIIIIRPHKRYYANQQDPRYKTLDVVKKLSEIRNCELEIIDW